MAQPLPVARLRLLYRLQQVDTSLARTEERLQALDAGETLQTRADETAAALAVAQQDLARKQSQTRDLELEFQSAVAKRKRVEEEMYSGRIRNPKELASMQEEVGALDRHARDLEDTILSLMEEVEALLGRVHELTEDVAATRTTWERHVTAHQREQAALEVALAALRREREEVALSVEEDLLRRYNRIRERMGPVAVAAVRKGICEGCHVAIPEGRVRRLQDDPDLLLTCERCGRILVVPDD